MTKIKKRTPYPMKILTFILSFGMIVSVLPTVIQAQETVIERLDGQINDDNITEETYRYLNLFGDVFERVRNQYVDETPDQDLIEKAINGMLTSLDPHSSFLNEDDFTNMRVQTKGEFGGLGIEVTMDNGLVKVVAPIEDTPADRAGLESGDLIVRIDGEEVMGLSLSEAVDKMRGPVGSDIIVTVIRANVSEPFDVEITRDTIKIQSVKHDVKHGDVGYLRITTFNQQVRDGLNKAIKDIKKQTKGKLKGFVLDLRNNPGGLLDQAIYVSDTFLDRGEIVSTRGREKDDIQRVNASKGDMIDGMPLVVLINGGSASASEIVAGALQDHHRAIVLGTKSFGKGSVQTVISLPGYGAIRLTTARYYTPSGRSIQAEGIEPDIIVERAKIEEVEDGYERAREADLQGALDKGENDEGISQKLIDRFTKSDDQKEDKEDEDDYQLLRAIDLVRGISQFQSYVRPQDEPIAQNDKTIDER